MNKIENLSLDSFSPICVLGKGSYAHVLLVQAEGAHCHDETIENFALKMLDKTDIEFRDMSSSVRRERDILLKLRGSHFATQLLACFQGPQEVCFLLEFCPGGDLFERMAQAGPMPEEHARFYVGQLVLALETLHRHQIVFRDLKPENLVFGRDGYLKLADFGCSATSLEGLEGLVGTPEYMAPEMVRGRREGCGYDYRVDWWALGCLMFELLAGRTPFARKSPKQLYGAIESQEPPRLPSVSDEANDLIAKLLDKNPTLRIGAQEAKGHAWFGGFDWESVREKRAAAPWTPETGEDFGIGNFNQKFVTMDFDGINCGMSEGLWLEDFYFESDQVSWVPRAQPSPGNEEGGQFVGEDEDDDEDAETDDDEFGRCGSFSDFDDDFEWGDEADESSWG